ncbi:MAG: hypothetical protein HY675_00870 [Chloroflexi bacterium]|nr:hypothetical protein [Chloroflexota bacterium]
MAMQQTSPNGPSAAAILASGIGSLALGVFTTSAQAFSPLREALNFYDPVGPLSGKTTMTVAIWLVAWAVAYIRWRQKEVDFGKVFLVMLVMVALGVLGTFPPIFELLGG